MIWRQNAEARLANLEKQIKALDKRLQPPPTKKNYLHLLYDLFDEQDVREMAFIVDVDYDNLEGDEKRGRLLSLVQMMKRQGRLAELEELARQKRPNVHWPVFK